MKNLRLIARLDIKMKSLIKGVQMEGWRKIGDPSDYALKYATAGADELLLMDVVASLYQRNSLHDIVKNVASNIFVPLTVGGGIRSVEDAGTLLGCGADKVALNTGACEDPSLITRISEQFGSQATVVSIEAMRTSDGRWTAMTDNGRNHTGRDVVEWAAEAESLGAGEVLITSVQNDGLGAGFDLPLIQGVADILSIPVIAGGGMGQTSHLEDLLTSTKASATAVAGALHYEKVAFPELRNTLEKHDYFVRPIVA